MLLDLTTLALCFLTGVAGFLFSAHNLHVPADAPLVGLLCALLPYWTLRLCADVLSNAADTLYLCFSIDEASGEQHCQEAVEAVSGGNPMWACAISDHQLTESISFLGHHDFSSSRKATSVCRSKAAQRRLIPLHPGASLANNVLRFLLITLFPLQFSLLPCIPLILHYKPLRTLPAVPTHDTCTLCLTIPIYTLSSTRFTHLPRDRAHRFCLLRTWHIGLPLLSPLLCSDILHTRIALNAMRCAPADIRVPDPEWNTVASTTSMMGRCLRLAHRTGKDSGS